MGLRVYYPRRVTKPEPGGLQAENSPSNLALGEMMLSEAVQICTERHKNLLEAFNKSCLYFSFYLYDPTELRHYIIEASAIYYRSLFKNLFIRNKCQVTKKTNSRFSKCLKLNFWLISVITKGAVVLFFQHVK